MQMAQESLSCHTFGEMFTDRHTLATSTDLPTAHRVLKFSHAARWSQTCCGGKSKVSLRLKRSIN